VGWQLLADIVKNSAFGNESKFAGPRGRRSKKDVGDTEIAVEVAGDRRSRIAVALHTDFRSQVHFVEFLRQSIFGVFQQYWRDSDLL
jgi:hypothetical protein